MVHVPTHMYWKFPENILKYYTLGDSDWEVLRVCVIDVSSAPPHYKHVILLFGTAFFFLLVSQCIVQVRAAVTFRNFAQESPKQSAAAGAFSSLGG